MTAMQMVSLGFGGKVTVRDRVGPGTTTSQHQYAERDSNNQPSHNTPPLKLRGKIDCPNKMRN